MPQELPCVSIVVIGYNEANNLHYTFNAIKSINYPKELIEVIYVDSGSTDGSVYIAKEYTNKVFVERAVWATPGLARNRGLVEAENEIIHFIDGDIIIDKDYLFNAVNKIQDKNIDAVYGFLIEKSQKGVNNLLLTHWKGRSEGYHNATGGGGTYKKSALLSINGYDERIRKGQETEMGERFLKASYKIWFIDKKMGEHDYGVKRLKDLFWIYYIEGINASHLFLLKGNTQFFKRFKRIAMNNYLFFIVFLVITFFSIFSFGMSGIIFVFILYYVYFILKYVFIKRVKGTKELLYAFLRYSMRMVFLYGQIKFALKCLFDRPYYRSVIKAKEILQH